MRGRRDFDTLVLIATGLLCAIGLSLIYGLAVWQRSRVARLHTFLGEVKVELKKVNWPGRREVLSTTTVVIVTVFVFGIFLSIVDLIFTWLRTQLFSATGLL